MNVTEVSSLLIHTLDLLTFLLYIYYLLMNCHVMHLLPAIFHSVCLVISSIHKVRCIAVNMQFRYINEV